MVRKKAPERTAPARDTLKFVDTGVPGLNEILGGGLPALSFNLVAGGPGSGKTTLTMQLLFANATSVRPGLFITLLGETSLKMLRYQQQFAFFDAKRVGTDVHFLNLTEEALSGKLDEVLERIVQEVGTLKPGFVVIDSFRSLVRFQEHGPDEMQLEHFVQRLALHLTSWEITSFLIGEYEENELRNPVFTVADGILWLSQDISRNSVVRKMQVVKARGVSPMPGLHTIRISGSGVQVFPRILHRINDDRRRDKARLSTGIPELDEMMGGGIPVGDSLVLAGPTGTGKTTFAMNFVGAGLKAGERAVVAIFEERPEEYLQRAEFFQQHMRQAVNEDRLRIIYLRPLDLSVDETFDEIRNAVGEIGATRVVIDSISGFEMALAPTFREDFRESLYRLIGALTGLGVTIFSTVEVVEGTTGLRLTGYRVSFLTDDILSQRYIEVEGELRKAFVIVKMRGSIHSREFRMYDITEHGVQLGQSLREYDNITTGMPVRQLRAVAAPYPGLLPEELRVLNAIVASAPLTAAQIAELTGLSMTSMNAVLERLVRLNYAALEGTLYRARTASRWMGLA